LRNAPPRVRTCAREGNHHSVGPAREADLLLVTRGAYGDTAAAKATDLLGTIQTLATDLGVRNSDYLRLAKAVVVVEGEHDREVIRKFYAGDLAKHRILLLSLRGVSEALALVELEYLSMLGLPITWLTDNARAEFLTRRPPLAIDATSSLANLSARARRPVRLLIAG
jgi:hypothetical protein